MITFTIALISLLLGYLIYGAVVDHVFGPKEHGTMPCYTKRDGVDYLPIAPWRVFLIQFLNIAGTGPIFGAILGILFGPAAYLWIVFGCIFAGAVHDYMCGMICVRKGGVSLPEMIGDELGLGMRILMRLTVFITTPAALLDNMIPDQGWLWSKWFWVVIILFYFLIATFLPIDKLIGKIYPLFGLALLIMALGIGWNIYTADGWMPELTDQLFTSHHPKGLPIFPILCVTIACGAISGFHGTQSPLMARCLTNEKYGRPIFYGSMITEGVVALIWAAATIKFASTLPGEAGATAYEKLASMGNPAIVVNKVSVGWMGAVGAILAVLGVVAAPITSGDTAFRSARLIAADFLHMGQKNVWSRLVLCLPLFAIATSLMFMDFDVLWRYFAWFNQTLACITLWAATVWLARKHKFYYICLLPAMFMTVVCSSYIVGAPEGFSTILSKMGLEASEIYHLGLIVGVALMVCLTAGFYLWHRKQTK